MAHVATERSRLRAAGPKVSEVTDAYDAEQLGDELLPVGRVLHDHAIVASGKGGAHRQPHRRAEKPRLDLVTDLAAGDLFHMLD